MRDTTDKLTGDLLDRLLEIAKAASSPPEPARTIWTAKAIGRRVGRSADWVRLRLSRLPGSPVHRIGGQWCADEAALVAFVSGNGGT